MATCCLSQTGAIFVLLAISKPCIWFRWSLYRFQPKSPHISSGTLGFPIWGHVQSFLCKSCICTAYRIPHIIPCSCVGCLLCCVLLFQCLLLRVGSDNVAFVRTRSSTSVCLLHGLVLLPWGISGKITIPSKSLLSLLASFSIYCYAAIPTTCFIMPPIFPCSASNPPCLSKPCLDMLPLCSAPLIALLVAGEDGVCSMLEHGYCWDIIIIYCLL